MRDDWPSAQWPDDEGVNRWWQDGFTDGADPEYEEQILPMAAEHLVGATRVLDVGTGEGQLVRLAAAGPDGTPRFVVGVDPTAAQIGVAAQRAVQRAAQIAAGRGTKPAAERGTDPAAQRTPGPAAQPATRGTDRRGHYAQASAHHLPFPDAAFDAVVACLVFEHIDDVDLAIAEVGRVLEPGGRFLFFLNHPLLQAPGSGWVDDQILEEQYWRIGPYLPEDKSLEEVDRGIVLPFIHRPLSRYVNALAANGLLVTRMEEPAPPPGFLARAHEYAEAAAFPRLLFLRAEKAGPREWAQR